MLKPIAEVAAKDEFFQPPSGGCVLKPRARGEYNRGTPPAAFGRLCVETESVGCKPGREAPAAFGRLCVETSCLRCSSTSACPAAFGRLCVETRFARIYEKGKQPAAFGRLCVETKLPPEELPPPEASRLRAAVC